MFPTGNYPLDIPLGAFAVRAGPVGPVGLVGPVGPVGAVGPVGPVGAVFSCSRAPTAPKSSKTTPQGPWWVLVASGAVCGAVCVRLASVFIRKQKSASVYAQRTTQAGVCVT